MRRMNLGTARGFSLIEVLIAVLVLSVGLLGLAGMQAASLRFNHNAYMRSQATFLAHDVIERMRANRTQALAGAYAIGFGDAPTAGTVAGDDLAQWKARLTRELPQGDGAVAVDAAGIATVEVRWDDARGDEGAENPEGGALLNFRVTAGL